MTKTTFVYSSCTHLYLHTIKYILNSGTDTSPPRLIGVVKFKQYIFIHCKKIRYWTLNLSTMRKMKLKNMVKNEIVLMLPGSLPYSEALCPIALAMIWFVYCFVRLDEATESVNPCMGHRAPLEMLAHLKIQIILGKTKKSKSLPDFSLISMHPAAQISSELKNCWQLKNVQQWPSFLRLSDPGYRGERCLFASGVTSTWLIASSNHQFTKVNNQRGNVEIGKIWDNNQFLLTWLRFSRCFFANERVEHNVITD